MSLRMHTYTQHGMVHACNCDLVLAFSEVRLHFWATEGKIITWRSQSQSCRHQVKYLDVQLARFVIVCKDSRKMQCHMSTACSWTQRRCRTRIGYNYTVDPPPPPPPPPHALLDSLVTSHSYVVQLIRCSGSQNTLSLALRWSVSLPIFHSRSVEL